MLRTRGGEFIPAHPDSRSTHAPSVSAATCRRHGGWSSDSCLPRDLCLRHGARCGAGSCGCAGSRPAGPRPLAVDDAIDDDQASLAGAGPTGRHTGRVGASRDRLSFQPTGRTSCRGGCARTSDVDRWTGHVRLSGAHDRGARPPVHRPANRDVRGAVLRTAGPWSRSCAAARDTSAGRVRGDSRTRHALVRNDHGTVIVGGQPRRMNLGWAPLITVPRSVVPPVARSSPQGRRCAAAVLR
jgi:hypothetical protein